MFLSSSSSIGISISSTAAWVLFELPSDTKFCLLKLLLIESIMLAATESYFFWGFGSSLYSSLLTVDYPDFYMMLLPCELGFVLFLSFDRKLLVNCEFSLSNWGSTRLSNSFLYSGSFISFSLTASTVCMFRFLFEVLGSMKEEYPCIGD